MGESCQGPTLQLQPCADGPWKQGPSWTHWPEPFVIKAFHRGAVFTPEKDERRENHRRCLAFIHTEG